MLLQRLKAMTHRFERGRQDLALETITGLHPVTPLMVRGIPDIHQVRFVAGRLPDPEPGGLRTSSGGERPTASTR